MDRIHSMRVFQRVCDEGSFAAAARALDLSPAAVTRFVADLEQALGVRLLHRTTRRLALTQAGEVYLDHVRRILVDLDEAHAQVSAHATELAGELRIGASPALATHMLAPLLAGFRALYPQVRLDIDATVSDESAIEDYDLTLFSAGHGFDADVIARTILASDMVLVASPDYLRRRGVPREPQALAGHDLLVLRRTGVRPGTLRLWPDQQPAQAMDLPIRPVLTANNPDTLLRAVLGGAGITATSLNLVAPYVTSGQLQRVLSPWVTGRLTMYAALPSRRFIPERARRFLDYLVERTRELSASALAACEACRDDGLSPPLLLQPATAPAPASAPALAAAAPAPERPPAHLPARVPAAPRALRADLGADLGEEPPAAPGEPGEPGEGAAALVSAPPIQAAPAVASEPPFVQAHELLQLAGQSDGSRPAPVLLDVRSAISAPRPDEDLGGALRAAPGHVPDAVRHLALHTPLVTVCACRGDAGALQAARELLAAGFRDVRVLQGGVHAWHAARAALRPSPAASPAPSLAQPPGDAAAQAAVPA